MTDYRVAILGCGPRGRQQAFAYQQHPRTSVVALCDLHAGRRDRLGDEVGVADRFADADRMIREVAPDLVAIPTGTEHHFDLCLAVLGHACHLDVEKPLCWELAQGDRLVRLARELGVKLAVHHQTRVGGHLRAAQAAIQAGQIGEPQLLIATDKGYYGGYGLLNIGTHLITNLVALAGHCRAVTATALTGGGAPTPADVVLAPNGMGPIVGEHLVATLEFDHHLLGWLRHQRFPRVDNAAYGYEIHGTAGRLYWRPGGLWLLDQPHYVPEAGPGRWTALPLPTHPAWTPAGPAQSDELWYVDEYVRALDEGRAHPCSGVEALHTLEVISGIFESVAWGRRVELPQARRDHPLLRWREEHRLPPPPAVPRDYQAWLAAEDQRLAGAPIGS